MAEEHWLNKMIIGRGTLKKFSEDYELVNASEGQFATASQLFPIGTMSEGEDKGMQTYEWVIYYKVNPNALKQINPETGKVEDKKMDMGLV